MDSNSPLGLIELVVVLAFALGWGILELMSLRMDKKKKADRAAASPDAEPRTGPK